MDGSSSQTITGERLLSINNYHYRRGGADVVFLEHNRLFAEMGWQILPFAMSHPRNLPALTERHFVEEIEFGEVYSLRDKAIRAARIVYSREARAKLEQLIADVRPTLAHAHNVYHHISPAIFPLLKREGIPTVMTVHD